MNLQYLITPQKTEASATFGGDGQEILLSCDGLSGNEFIKVQVITGDSTLGTKFIDYKRDGDLVKLDKDNNILLGMPLNITYRIIKPVTINDTHVSIHKRSGVY